MKLLFISSQPKYADSAQKFQELRNWHDVTKLHQAASQSGSGQVSITTLQNCIIEELPHLIRYYKPEILHISSHGEKDRLALANQDGREVELSAQALQIMLQGETVPKLVFLSACNSSDIAQELTQSVPLVVCFSSSISHPDALRVTRAFYDAIFSGQSVLKAHQAGDASLKGAPAGSTRFELIRQQGIDPATVVPCPSPQLLARFVDDRPGSNSHYHAIEFGLRDCPRNSLQVVFFTTSRFWVKDPRQVNPKSMCSVTLTDLSPTQKEVWTTDAWDMPDENWIIYACCVTNHENEVLVKSDTRSALQRYYTESRLSGLNARDREIVQQVIYAF